MPHSRSELSTLVHTGSYKYIKLTKNYITIKVQDRWGYDIHRDQCRTTKEICEWLGQIAEKSWCTPYLLGELVMAFTDVNGDLRGIE